MPTIRVLGPAALRSRVSSVLPLALTFSIAGPMHGIGSACLAHDVTSLPPIETVTSLTLPRWRLRNRTAAAVCVRPPYLTPPGPREPHFDLRSRIETVV